MSKEIYISTTPHETRLAIVEDEQLAEIYYERENEYTLAGSIYNGKVTRVLPGMQSSFVDVGLERDAFLYVTDFMEEQGDAADFETDGGGRRTSPQAPREGQREAAGSAPSAPREASREGERRGRGDRDRDRGSRGGRDRGRAAPEPAGETQMFEEPVAPRPAEESAAPELENEAALDGQGSRRWRGRRGRRRGRGGAAMTNADVVTGTYAEQVEPELLAGDEETVSLEGSVEIADRTVDVELGRPIEIDLGAEPRAVPGGDRGQSARRDEDRRGGRDGRRDGGRDRGGRDRGDRESRGGSGFTEVSSRPYGGGEQGGSRGLEEEFAVPAGEPIVLPGESIRKYRDPAEVAAEEAVRRASLPASAEMATTVAPSVEVVGWDGGAVLPGETLSRHRNREQGQAVARPERTESSTSADQPQRRTRPDGANYVERSLERSPERSVSLKPSDLQAYSNVPEVIPVSLQASDANELIEAQVTPTPIADTEAIAPAAVPEETGGLTQHPAHADESAAVGSVIAGATQAESGEYEPREGERASFGDAGHRDYRRLEQRPEEAVQEVSAVDPELIADGPDATVYDLDPAEAIAQTGDLASSEGHFKTQEVARAEEPTFTHSRAEEFAPGHTFTTLQPTGEMLSEVSLIAEESSIDLPPVQDRDRLDTPVAQEYAVQSVLLQDAETTPERYGSEPDESGDASIAPQVHAYGDGDLQEEEVDGDEYEYDLALASIDEEEFEEYEEETLDGSADLESVLQELSLDDDDAEEGTDEGPEEVAGFGAGGFSVEDFGGEPDESTESTAGQPAQDAQRGGRREGRRGSRDRERRGGGFRGGAGGDRGGSRGRGRQSVQTMDLPAINELLKPGQEILVQIAKEPIAKKGARITSHIALPGRFLVFMPTVNHTGVSRKISSDEERRRLKSILLSEKGDAQGGFIVRTAADGASEEELRNDLRFLIQLWQDIKARSESSKSPALIYHDLSLIERILRDQVTDNFSAIWVDTETEYERVLRFLQRFQPSLVRRVKLYTKETPLFEHFGVTQEIDKALKSKVWLKSGGSIVIDQTEALVAIDINTGKYVGKTARLEDTILKTNLDAIPEIVRQIRLRDLGGIIVIDFIDMDERKNRAKVMQVLEDELKHDRAPSKVLPFNDFGLVIMTRKRVKQSLERTLCIPDPITEGTGMIKSPITIANEIYIEMRKMHRHLEKGDVMLRVHPEVVKQLKAAGGKRLQELEEMTKKTILVKSDPAINPEQFDIH